MTKQEVILNFIKQFRDLGAENCFSNGMCYHFSLILCTRFKYSARRVYDPIINHFAVEIDGKIYDITGDITENDQYKWHYWDLYQYEDPLHTDHIRRDCMWKVPAGVIICEFCGHSFEDDWGTLICDRNNCPTTSNNTCEWGENR